MEILVQEERPRMNSRRVTLLVLLRLALSAQVSQNIEPVKIWPTPQPIQLSTRVFETGRSVRADVAAALTVIFQNTANPTGTGFSFNGAMTVGNNLIANVDINKLTFASGSSGKLISQLTLLAYSYNTVAVEAQPTLYLWATDGASGNPGTLLGSFVLPLTSFAADRKSAG